MSGEHDDLRDFGPWGEAVALTFRFLLLAVFVIACGWLISNIRRIPSDSQAVVLRFGKVVRVQAAGLLLVGPPPFEQVIVLPASARQLELPVRRYQDNSSGSPVQGYDPQLDPRLNSAFLMTGDSSIVHLEAQLFYQISDPVAYMISSEHVAPALERLFIASAVGVVADRDLDSILVARPEIASRESEAAQRGRLRSDLVRRVNQRLAMLAQTGSGLGVTVSRVDLVPSIPAGAKRSFDNVLVVTQDAQTAVANARTRAEMIMQDANRARDRIASSATASAEETSSNATTQTASITAMGMSSQEMSRSMQVQRLYYDRIATILKKAGRIDIIEPSGTVRTIAPGGTR